MPRQDLCICKLNELESTFIEITNPKKKTNIIIGCIYRHPTMNLNQFNDWMTIEKYYHKKYQKKRKMFFVLGDFNVDLL